MVKNHLSRLAVPNVFGIPRKGKKWIARPKPGPHPLKQCLTISVLLRDKLGYAKTRKEIQKILNDSNLLVDKKIRKEYAFPVGFMDVVESPKMKEAYRVIYDTNGKLVPVKIDVKEANVKVAKVIGKSLLKKNNLQLNLYDGKNVLGVKDKVAVGDSVVLDLTGNKVTKVLAMQKGALIFLTAGKYVGHRGVVKEIKREQGLENAKVVFELNGKDHVTLLDYAFVVGKGKAEVTAEVSK